MFSVDDEPDIVTFLFTNLIVCQDSLGSFIDCFSFTILAQLNAVFCLTSSCLYSFPLLTYFFLYSPFSFFELRNIFFKVLFRYSTSMDIPKRTM